MVAKFQERLPVRLRWAIAFSLGLLGVMGGSVFYFTRSPTVEPAPEATVQPLAFSTVNALGRIEPENETIQIAAPATLGGASRVRTLSKQAIGFKPDK